MNEQQHQYIFVFDFGVLIFWNFLVFHEKEYLHKFAPYYVKPLRHSNWEHDVILAHKELVQTSKIENNTIYLNSITIDEKLANVYAMA